MHLANCNKEWFKKYYEDIEKKVLRKKFQSDDRQI